MANDVAAPPEWLQAQRYQRGEYTPTERDFLYFGGQELPEYLRQPGIERKILLRRMAEQARGRKAGTQERIPGPSRLRALADWYQRLIGRGA